MIIKSLSAKSKAGIGRLVKYVLKEQRTIQSFKEKAGKSFFVPGVRLTAKDIMYLKAEMEDGRLMELYKNSGCTDYKEFIEKYLTNPDHTFTIHHNLRSGSIDFMIKAFEASYETREYKRADMTSIHHDIISFSPSDTPKLTPEILQDLADKYISLRADKSLCLAIPHFQKSHVHLHFLVSSGTLQNKSARVSKEKYREIKDMMQSYQKLKYPELNSLPEHGKSRQSSREAIEKNLKTERTTYKEAVLRCLDEASAKASSREQFISLLQANHIEPYQRTGKEYTGVVHNGFKFRFSRLDIDITKKLQQLDEQKAKEEKLLRELQHLREGRNISKERNPEKDTEQKEILNDIAREALDELEAIRQGQDEEMDRSDDPHDDCQNDSGNSNDELDDMDTETDTDQELHDTEAEEELDDGDSPD